MSQALSLLKRTEEEISALLVAGLATQRGGREQLEELSGELSALKLERLALELRNLASGQDPAALASSAFTALAMARKFQERLAPWPEIDPEGTQQPIPNSSVRIALPGEGSDAPDISTLSGWMETGNELLRAHAATLTAQKGEEAIPELTRLASKGAVAIRREAIAAMGKIGGETAQGVLVDLLGDIHCWRALLQATLPWGQAVIPLLTDALAATTGKKGQENRRIMSAALLYRLGAYGGLQGLARNSHEDPVVYGLAVASRARAGGGWIEPPEKVNGVRWSQQFPTLCTVAMARFEANGNVDPIIEIIDGGAINEVRSAVRWMASCTPLEVPLAAHYLGQLAAGRSKDRDRAASVLRGLANPDLAPELASLVRAEATPAADIAEILAEAGGSHAVGILLDLARGPVADQQALKGLGQLGDPGSAPGLLELLETSRTPVSVEQALIALDDGAADFLWREMQAREGSPLATRIQQVLLQMKGRRAKSVLKGVKAEGIEDLIPRLGHPKLGPVAARSLARHGEAVLDHLEKVLSSNNLTARLNALNCVGSIKGAAASELLFRVVEGAARNAKHGAEAMVYVRGIELLGKRDQQRTTPLLARGLATGVYNVQEAAARALVKMGDEVAAQVTPLLAHPEPSVRARAIEVLGKLQLPEAEEKAIELLSDANRPVQIAAATALGSIGAATGNPRAAEALGIMLRNDRSGWPQPIIQALIATGQRGAIPYLREFAKSGAPTAPGFGDYLRRQALEAIKQIESTTPPPPSQPPQPGGGLAGRFRRLLGGK